MKEKEFQEFMYNLPRSEYSQNLRKSVMIGNIRVSIQGSKNNYSDPRENGMRDYSQWEIGFPSEVIPEFIPYVDGWYENPDYTNQVYGWVPTQIILNVITRLGGIKEYQKEETQ